MADLTYIEKETIENFLDMKGGYVMDFSDRTFQEFVGSITGYDIDDHKYIGHTASKANRLRTFFKQERNYVVGLLISGFADYWLSKAHAKQIDFTQKEALHKECLKIAERLKQETLVEHIDAIKAISDDKDFKLLAKSIRESIDKNEPEVALDRLHTYVVKFIRQLCDNHNISYDKDAPLNSVYGKYVKYLSERKLLDSEMAERILKYSIHVLEAFNDVRNNKSFAHDNPILNYHESILIFNSVSNSIKFIQTLEDTIKPSGATEVAKAADEWDLPF